MLFLFYHILVSLQLEHSRLVLMENTSILGISNNDSVIFWLDKWGRQHEIWIFFQTVWIF